MWKKKSIQIFLFLICVTLFLKFVSFYNAIPPLQDEKNLEKTDAIVVFTGGSKRVLAAVDLFEKGLARLLFVSGVPKGVTKHNILRASHSRIQDLSTVYLGGAENTQENAQEVAKWATEQGIKSVRLVTTTFHMPRALREMNLKAKNISVVSHPISADHIPIYASAYYYFSEFIKLTLLDMGIEYPDKQSVF